MSYVNARPLLVAFTQDFATDEQMRGVLDGLPGVLFWYQCISGQIFVVTTTTAADLAESIEILFKYGAMKHMFYVAELNPAAMQGRLPNQAWAVITQAVRWPLDPPPPIPGVPGVS
ncbi:MAG TPA: hypothetical protein VFA43_10765 [Gemmatimonadaceae bacterium]|nr:hypothetical protein [Gemmatimonadaceae bacterium]